MNISKNLKIKNSILATREKRKSQKCRIIELKIIESSLNKIQKETLKMFFIEAKWLYNDILSWSEKGNDVFKYDIKNKIITALDKDKNTIKKELKYLPSKPRCDIALILFQNISNLSKKKQKGLKIGKLKYKSSINSIELSQYKITHEIKKNNNFRINGIKKPLKVRGLDQLKNTFEYANAK